MFQRCHTITLHSRGASFSYVEKMNSSKVTLFLLLFLLQNLLKIKTKTQKWKSPFFKNNLKSSDLLLVRNCDTSDVFTVLAAAAGLLHDSSVRDYLVFKRGRKKSNGAILFIIDSNDLKIRFSNGLRRPPSSSCFALILL